MAALIRAIRSSLLESRPTLPPTFLLPFRANLTTASQTSDAGNVPPPPIQPAEHDAKDEQASNATPEMVVSTTSSSSTSRPRLTPHSRQDVVTKNITPSIRDLLPLLHSQPAHYISIHIHGRPYLLTQGDTLRLPFRMSHIQPGDVLRLNRATHIGSRDYTLKAPEPMKGTADHGKQVFYLDERLFTCRARVIGVDTEPMRVEEKTKRRQRHVKHVYSKMRFTLLMISELSVKSLAEYEGALKQNKKVSS